MSESSKSAFQHWLQSLSGPARVLFEGRSQRGRKRDAPVWFAVYIDETQPGPQYQQFHSFDQLRGFLSRLPEYTFVISGFGLRVPYSVPTADGLQYVVHPDGRIYPLFQVPKTIEIDNTHRLGAPDPALNFEGGADRLRDGDSPNFFAGDEPPEVAADDGDLADDEDGFDPDEFPSL